MIEPLVIVKQNRCAICDSKIDHEQYYCFSVAPTNTEGNRIQMGYAQYGYLCTVCGENLKNLFTD